jgi:hypothetical protein
MHVPNMNNGTQDPPSLRIDLNMGTLADLPHFTKAPRAEGADLYQALRAAGFEGIQGGDLELCRKAGLRATTAWRVDRPGEAHDLARQWQDAGFDCVTLHVGTGFESEDDMRRVVEDIVRASDATGFPLYIETHRATITQDIWRTVRLVELVPDMRINGDFSHWYTGHEMVYGDINAKFDFAGPVFERTRYMHGRIGNPGSIQAALGDCTGDNVKHFREMWTRAFAGFLRTAKPGDTIGFAPEVLPSSIFYARKLRSEAGELVEESDRWEDALTLVRIARECFAAARERVAAN